MKADSTMRRPSATQLVLGLLMGVLIGAGAGLPIQAGAVVERCSEVDTWSGTANPEVKYDDTDGVMQANIWASNAGRDTLRSLACADDISGNEDNDDVGAGSSVGYIENVHGNNNNDIVYGGADEDQMYGGPGADSLYDAEGPDNDWLYGGDGIDLVDDVDGDGNDTLDGEAGSDTCRGNWQDTFLHCETI